MGELLAKVLPLALGAAVSPTVLAMQAVTLAGTNAPLRRAWATAAGYLTVLLAEAGAVLILAAGTGGPDTSSDTAAYVKLGAAALLLALGVRALLRTPPEKTPHPTEQSPRLGRYFALGAGSMILNFTTVALFFPAVHEVGISDVGVALQAVTLVVVVAITLLPASGPPVAVMLLGERVKPGLIALNNLFSRHQRVLSIILCFGFAAFLAYLGVKGLR